MINILKSRAFLLLIQLLLLITALLQTATAQTNEIIIKIPVADYSKETFNNALVSGMQRALVQLGDDPQAAMHALSAVDTVSEAQRCLRSYQYSERYFNGGQYFRTAQVQLWLSLVFDRTALMRWLPALSLHDLPTQPSLSAAHIPVTSSGIPVNESGPAVIQEQNSPTAASASPVVTATEPVAGVVAGSPSMAASSPSVQSPTVLVWVTPSTAMLLSGWSDESLQRLLQHQAEAYHFALLFPEMDLEDENIVGVNQDALFNEAALEKLAKRYHVAAVLVGRIVHSDDQRWSVRWKLWWHHDIWQWRQHALHINSLISAAMEHLQQQFSDRALSVNTVNPSQVISNDPSGQYQVILQVDGVHSEHDEMRVMNYLRHLPIVTEVDAIRINKKHFIMRVKAIGGKSALIAVLSTSARWHAAVHQPTNGILNYRWKRHIKYPIQPQVTQSSSSVQFIDDSL